MKGRVDHIPSGQSYGFLTCEENGVKYFFHKNNFRGAWNNLRLGDVLTFSIGEFDGRPQAVDVVPDINTPVRPAPVKTIEPYNGPIVELSDSARKKALQDISNWKLEAKLDDLKRYFYTVPVLSKIIDGDVAYVVGRKGTGKSALVQYISEQDNELGLVSKLTFKNFPFNELYAHGNDSYRRPNQYITLWKLIIYSAACRSISRSRFVDPLVKRKIDKAFPPAASDHLGTVIGSWISGDFGFNVLGSGITISNWFKNKRTASLQEKVENIESFVIKHMPDEKIIVLFDELDEDYRDIFESYSKSDYLDLLTSLFKAVQDVRSAVTVKGLNLLPVVFLRDDIYDLLKDPDKNKWRDLEVDLEWRDDGIRHLLAHRLSKVVSEASSDFDELWYSLFSRNPIKYSDGKKEIRSYDYIRMSTQGRPRDYINYLQECAELELRRGGSFISRDSVRDADKAYSNYLKAELIDEIHGIIPDIESVLGIFSEMRKSILSIDEFRRAYNERIEVKSVKIHDVDMILRTLFYFSVIGNVVRVGLHVFKHDRPNAELNFKEKIVVHRGLVKALQII